ncbi:MAG TPA: HAMP domain-containing sensor histidine kinase [Flavobacterium sp.]|jgi:two-component system, sporulation sensor kinase D|uniref:sensor histidine kinase n=1 Tax=Flavobacterium sp. TaxID=239 RepID=UPI0025C0C7BA|nr:HAMP domain-containing sensor histidine kinase [Flavobacterium sp.]MBA4154294.1 two-component sensor histidine kinase [Flavobacterium sp.]HRZ31022.1 HAMP domain-containing sensor histidine kinase [Flavobacterium sp.]HRZ73729.1 HAMP domain-containing sensor histidine kinase [Flavobacterium sp.]
MQFSESRNVTRWILILTSFVIVSLILWNTYTFFQRFKKDERLKMELWAEAQTNVFSSDVDADISLPLKIISNTTTIPIIVTDENDSIVNKTNIEDIDEKDSAKLRSLLEKLKKENDPIVMEYVEGKFRYLYYGDSSLLNKLKYYPLALLLIIFLFGLLVFNFYQTSKIATQNKLWAGMAKETAHQIGTPLSSLIGWLEILKAENVAESTLLEIQKDITRLQTITDRFSKVGSEPVLEKLDIIAETEQSYDYLKSRFSKQVEFTFLAPPHPIFVSINPALHSWTIENLVKNAIDAMKGRGKLDLNIIEEEKEVRIYVSDSGKGIPKNQFKKVFDPGFTTKKRGWGLGLSLTKRIVEEYHKGKIKVHHSEIDKGTTMMLSFKKTTS